MPTPTPLVKPPRPNPPPGIRGILNPPPMLGNLGSLPRKPRPMLRMPFLTRLAPARALVRILPILPRLLLLPPLPRRSSLESRQSSYLSLALSSQPFSSLSSSSSSSPPKLKPSFLAMALANLDSFLGLPSPIPALARASASSFSLISCSFFLRADNLFLELIPCPLPSPGSLQSNSL